MNPGGDDDLTYCAGQAWIDCDDALGWFGPNPCGCDIAETGMSAGQVGEYNVEGIDECCGDDANEYLAPYCDPGNPANGNRVCCPSSDYCTYPDETCKIGCEAEGAVCTQDSECCQNPEAMHCDDYHPDGSGDYHCCPMDEKWSDTFNSCVGTDVCTVECNTPWNSGCVGVGPGCNADQFCCSVPYQTQGDCFDMSDAIMGAWPY